MAEDPLAEGPVEGTAGQRSARMPDGNRCITPSSVDHRAMALEGLCVIDPSGEMVEGSRAGHARKRRSGS